MASTYRQCRKCLKFSGDDWSQCGDACPMEGSPHFKAWAEDIYGRPVVMTEAEMNACHAEKTTGKCGVCGVNEGKRDHLVGFRCDDAACIPF